MPTIFTRIIEGELPGRFVWRDDRCVAFLSIEPLRPGHTLVVPIDEVDHWIDLEPDLLAHLSSVAQTIGRALQAGFRPARVGMMLVGLDVPHVHLHVSPIDGPGDLDFANADHDADPADLDRAAETIRTQLRELGAAGVVDG